ncbi:hypothetical protein JRI60_52185 [Archangium violaceum]|uniref:DUF3592 domain-containing protein n=1 Tax=Archangium violaceum TaxID=83451 RepID=UPI00195005BB|nr:DUF3592 domain-containing protein [Archangium violaceum]QRN97409.1 hypothetical protein JRI60_52185 [Archangium violaceum]
MIVIAVATLAFSGFEFLRTFRFVLYAEAAQAVVVSSSRERGQYLMFKGYPERVTFSDSSGNEHTAAIYYGQPGLHRLGKTVKVLYKEYDPVGTARYGDASQLWLLPGAFLFVGAMGLYSAFVVRNRGY